MPRFTFTCDHNDDMGPGPVLTFETERLFLDDVIMDFQDFLKGCGFVFDGELQIFKDDFEEAPTEEFGHGVMDWTVNELTKEPNANQG
jgi:hypothetical protein